MIRRCSNPFVLAFPILSAALVLLAADAAAQVTNIAYGGGVLAGVDVPGNGGGFTYSNVNGADGSGVDSVVLDVTGDWDYKLPRAAVTSTITMRNYLDFSVGNVPVQISDFGEVFNAKWANGGGLNVEPKTSWQITATLYEQPTAGSHFVDTDPIVLITSFSDNLTGNGYKIDDGSSFAGVDFVLSANLNYYLALTVTTTVNATGSTFPQTEPTIVVTNEFGPPLSTYDGYSVGLNWQKVPEPSTFALAIGAAIGVCVYRFRRRR